MKALYILKQKHLLLLSSGFLRVIEDDQQLRRKLTACSSNYLPSLLTLLYFETKFRPRCKKSLILYKKIISLQYNQSKILQFLPEPLLRVHTIVSIHFFQSKIINHPKNY